MNFDWTDTQAEAKKQVAGLLNETILAGLDSLETADTKGIKEILQQMLVALSQTNYLKLAMGPGELDKTMDLIAAQEELAGASASLFLATEVSTRLFGGLLAGFGSEEQKHTLLDLLQKGRLIGAVALGDADEENPVTAKADGDRYILNGIKPFVTNGPIAGCIAVLAVMEHDKKGFFLIDPNQTGVTIGDRIATMGYQGLAVAPLELNDVSVTNNNVIGSPASEKAIVFLRNMEDLALTMAGIGIMGRTMTTATSYAKEHKSGGRPIIKYQEVGHKLSEILTILHTSQMLVYRAGWMMATGDSEARALLDCAKVFSSEASEQAATYAMQIMAGKAFVSGNPVERAYRDSKYAGLAGTSNERARMSIADQELDKYRG